MLDEKKLSEAGKRTAMRIGAGDIVREEKGRFVQFFLSNAKNSFESAKLLFGASTNENLKNAIGLSDFNGFLWAINASYYSMFYMARALLEKEGIKIKTELSIHSVTFDALVYYFYLTGKLEKKLIEEFAEAGEESMEALGKQKARELIEDYLYEKSKRAKFTYEIGEVAMKEKAKTSLERAKRFNEEIRKILET